MEYSNTGHYINVLGDSHTRSFTHSVNFLSVFIGPGKEVNFTSDSQAQETCRRLRENISRMDKSKDLMLVFGEPDNRLYLENYNGIRDQVPEDDYIVSTTDRFLSVLLDIKDLITGTLIVYNAVPCPRQEQNLLSTRYNSRLNDLCSSNGILFIDIWPQMVDEDGALDESYSVDHIHLNEKAATLVTQILKHNHLLPSDAKEEADYSWAYFYKLRFGGDEVRIWGDLPVNKSKKFQRSEGIRSMIATHVAPHVQSNKRILFLQCAEGFPLYSLPDVPYEVCATDLDKDRILQARRLQNFAGLENVSFVEYEDVQWSDDFDMVVYLEQDDDNLNARFAAVIEKVSARVKLTI